MFYTWGVSGCPTFIPPVCLYAPIHSYAPRGVHPPYAPILFYASVCFWRLCMLWGVVMGSPLCWDTLPYITPFGGASTLLHPHSVIGSLCSGMFQGYQYVMLAFPFCQEGFGGVFPISWGVGASALKMSISSFLYLFCSALFLMF